MHSTHKVDILIQTPIFYLIAKLTKSGLIHGQTKIPSTIHTKITTKTIINPYINEISFHSKPC